MNNYLLLLLLVLLKDKGGGQSKQRTLANVPDVIGKDQVAAENRIRENGLNPVSESILIPGGKDEDEGKVVDQVPKSGFVRPGTDVKLLVSSGAAPSTPENDSAVHLRIEKDVEDAQKQILDAQATIIAARDMILKAIEEKDNPTKPVAGATEKKQSS